MRPYLIVLLCIFVSGIVHPYEVGKKYEITFYHVNDTHGSFQRLPMLATMVKKVRLEAKASKSLFFLTSGGDVNTGSPESDLLMAEPDFRSMKWIGFDAMVLGNHEFDRHWQHLFKQQEWGQFPFVAANIRPLSSEPLPFSPFLIKKVQGLKVAFLGLSTEQTPHLTFSSHIQGLAFDPAIATAAKWVPYLRQRADVVVVLSHLGWCEKGKCAPPNDVLLAQSVPGIDVILGGHSHSSLDSPDTVNGTLILQAGESNLKVAVLRVEFLNSQLTLKGAELKPINAKEDPALKTLVTPYIQSVAQKLTTVVGETFILLDGERSNVRYKETTLGNFVAKAFRRVTSADLAIVNSGGIRASIPRGKITYGDLLKVHPFGNTICAVELRGGELKSYMEKVVAMPPGEGSFPQMSGVEVMTDTDNKIVDLKINGQKIELQKTYKVALNNFMADGRDFYPKVSHLSSFVNTGISIDAGLRLALEEDKIVPLEDVKVRGYFQKKN